MSAPRAPQAELLDLGAIEAVFALGWRNWRTVIGMALACGILAFASTYLMTRTYRASIVVSAAEDDSEALGGNIASSFSGVATALGIAAPSTARHIEAIALLSSRELTEQVIADEQLLPLLFADDWDAASKSWDVSDPRKVPTLQDGYVSFDRDVRSLTEDKLTGLVTLHIDWSDPKLAARWARLMVDRVNQRLRQRAIAEANHSIAYLEGELRKTSVVESQQMIYHLIEVQMGRAMLATVREDYALRIVENPLPSDADRPIRPHRLLIAFMGLMLGGIAGMSLAYRRERRPAD